MGVRQPATDVTKTTAVLNGKVLSTTGGRGSYFIEYGPDTARELKTPTRPIDFVNGESTPVVEPVDGLEPETTYHFAVCAEDSENPGDAFCSPDQTFTTDPPGTDRFTTAQSPFPGSLRNQGWWSPTSSNHDVNPNYIAGSYDGDNRNFFSFDLSSACQATEVTLQLTRFRQTGSLTYSLFDVSTPAAVLNANNGTSQAIFDDLGSGTAFGSFPVDPGARPTSSASGSTPRAWPASTRLGVDSSRSAEDPRGGQLRGELPLRIQQLRRQPAALRRLRFQPDHIDFQKPRRGGIPARGARAGSCIRGERAREPQVRSS